MKVRLFRLGLDWITYRFLDMYSDIFLDSFFLDYSETANQRFGVEFFGRQFDVTYIEAKTKHILIFQYQSTSVFEFVKIWKRFSISEYSYKFSFFCAYFYLDDLSDVLLAFTKRYVQQIAISRLDIALDTDIPIPVLYKRKRTQFQKQQLFKSLGVLTGFYLGARKGNKKFFIRVYDKKLDSKGKEKFHLFFPYLLEEAVSRIEAELLVLTLQTFGITPQTIIEYEEARMTNFVSKPNCLEQYFASLCLNKQGTYFYPLKSLDFANVERLTTATYKGKSEYILDEVSYIKDWLGRGVTLHNMKLDPVGLLQHHLAPKPPMEPSSKLFPYTDTSF